MSRDLLFVTVDSLRADHVGYHGYERDTTPRLDEVASSAHIFSNAFAHACSTRASFPSIMTSSYPRMYGGFERLSERRTLVSEVLREGGYRTAGFHSNLFLAEDFGYGRGFETFFDSREDPSITARARQFVKDNLDQDGLLYRALKAAFDATERRAGIEIGSAYVSADDVTDMAIDWIEDADPEAPHFLWVHYMDVHHPYVPPAEHQRAFRENPIDDRESIRLRRKMLERPDEVTDEELDAIVDLYDAEIRFADAEIGRLIDAAREAWDDPVVAFTADHGEEFREHGRFSHHGTFHDEVTHVPLLFEDGRGGSTHEEVVGLIDVAPTLLEYAGLDAPEDYYGRSLVPIVDGSATSTPEAVVGFNFCRTKEWKYVLDEERAVLYDLEADPGETTDVSDEHPEVAADLRGRIEDLRAEIEATAEDLGEVEMDEDIQERLRALGYRE